MTYHFQIQSNFKLLTDTCVNFQVVMLNCCNIKYGYTISQAMKLHIYRKDDVRKRVIALKVHKILKFTCRCFVFTVADKYLYDAII